MVTPRGKADAVMTEELAKLAKLAQEQAKAVINKLPLLGPIAWLMMQQAAHRHAFIADLEWRILPPLVLDQAKLYMKDNMPLAFASWARLSDDVAGRYRMPPYRLAPGEWKSGNDIWIVDIIAPFGGGADVLKDLRESVFPTSRLRQLAPAPDASAEMVEWPPIRAAS